MEAAKQVETSEELLEANPALEPQARIKEIIGWLIAYRYGWIVYDQEHVRQLQAERAALLKAGA